MITQKKSYGTRSQNAKSSVEDLLDLDQPSSSAASSVNPPTWNEFFSFAEEVVKQEDQKTIYTENYAGVSEQ